MAKAPDPHPSRTRWFTPVVTLVRGLFVAQLRLERRDGQIHVVLRDAPKNTAPKPLPANPPGRIDTQPKPPPVLGVDAAQLQRMQAAIAQVLDRHVGSRKVLKHLGYLEHVLRRQGSRCFMSLPVEVLKPALHQLNSVMGPQPSQGLTELHACLVVTVVDRDVEVDDDDANGRLSVFAVGDKVQVCEVSHSDFVNADQPWPLVAEPAMADTAAQ